MVDGWFAERPGGRPTLTAGERLDRGARWPEDPRVCRLERACGADLFAAALLRRAPAWLARVHQLGGPLVLGLAPSGAGKRFRQTQPGGGDCVRDSLLGLVEVGATHAITMRFPTDPRIKVTEHGTIDAGLEVPCRVVWLPPPAP